MTKAALRNYIQTHPEAAREGQETLDGFLRCIGEVAPYRTAIGR